MVRKRKEREVILLDGAASPTGSTAAVARKALDATCWKTFAPFWSTMVWEAATQFLSFTATLHMFGGVLADKTAQRKYLKGSNYFQEIGNRNPSISVLGLSSTVWDLQ